uniref:Uncharacterized protein n=1 Tax=Arundo donax TaxID=35708 RepID=A0A0A9CMU1_ARUDO
MKSALQYLNQELYNLYKQFSNSLANFIKVGPRQQ